MRTTRRDESRKVKREKTINPDEQNHIYIRVHMPVTLRKQSRIPGMQKACRNRMLCLSQSPSGMFDEQPSLDDDTTLWRERGEDRWGKPQRKLKRRTQLKRHKYQEILSSETEAEKRLRL